MSVSRLSDNDDLLGWELQVACLPARAGVKESLDSAFAFLEEPHTRTRSGLEKGSSFSVLHRSDLDHAAPLMPLRERDVKALSNWFELDEIDEIEADIAHNLVWLLPEPCWEDDPFDFLKEFL